MAPTLKVRIGLKDIRELKPGWTLWDNLVPGFCARRRKSPSVVYGLKYRTSGGRQRWQTIGRHGAPWTPDTARDEARRILAEVVQGKDPAGVKFAKRRTTASPSGTHRAGSRGGVAQYGRQRPWHLASRPEYQRLLQIAWSSDLDRSALA